VASKPSKCSGCERKPTKPTYTFSCKDCINKTSDNKCTINNYKEVSPYANCVGPYRPTAYYCQNSGHPQHYNFIFNMEDSPDNNYCSRRDWDR